MSSSSDSIYTQCSIATAALTKEGEPFSELDVIRHASDGHAWTTWDFAEADTHAPQVLAARYRAGHVVRFGPVDPAKVPLTGEADYVRKDGCILYGGTEQFGETGVWTPNGDFDAIHYGEDPLSKAGRRKVHDRDDFTPWADQIESASEVRPHMTALKRENDRLKLQLAAAQKRIAQLEGASPS